MACGRKHGTSRFGDASGASAVEFALVMPVFLLLVLGALAYGIYFGAAHSVQQLAADAARVAVAGLDDAERIALVERYLRENTPRYVLLQPGHLVATIGPSPESANHFNVGLRYDARHLPIWNLNVPLPASREIVFASVIRNGGH